MICGSQRLDSHPIRTVSLGVNAVPRTWQSSREAERPTGSESPKPFAESRKANRWRLSASLYFGGGRGLEMKACRIPAVELQ